MSEQKFKNILKDFNFNNINKDTFPQLIDSGIFDEFELSDDYKSEEDYFGIETQEKNEIFSDWFLFNRKEYSLKKEIKFEVLKEQVKYFELIWNMSCFEDYINTELAEEFSDIKKQEVLEKIYKKEYSLLPNKQFFIDYQKIQKTGNPLKWFEYLNDELEGGNYIVSYEEQYSFISKYLKDHKGIGNLFPEKICEVWKDCYTFLRITEALELKRTQLLKKTTSNQKESTDNKFTPNSFDTALFRENGLNIFNCIISYSTEKNKAFFSYLFFFMLDKKLLKVNGSTNSTKYINYIESRFHIKMSRIINSQAYERTERKSKIEEFEDILKLHLHEHE
jgi:hypothetical protein